MTGQGLLLKEAIEKNRIDEALFRLNEISVKELLDDKYDINTHDVKYCNHNTLLMLALRKGDLGTFKLLLEKGANPNLGINRYCKTPLMMACTKKEDADHRPIFDFIELLIDNGANADHIDNDGKTALILAICNKGNDSVKKILEGGKDTINHTDKNYKSALNHAISRCNLYVVELLLSNGAEITEADKIENNRLLYYKGSTTDDKQKQQEIKELFDKIKANNPKSDIVESNVLPSRKQNRDDGNTEPSTTEQGDKSSKKQKPSTTVQGGSFKKQTTTSSQNSI